MKTLKLLTLIGFIALLFTACEEDEFDIVGKWNRDKITYETYLGASTSGTPLFIVPVVNDGWVQFNDDGSGTDNEQGTFNWTLTGNALTINPTGSISFTITLTTKTSTKMVGTETSSFFEGDAQYTMKVIYELRKL
jgi:hypothetical protein